MQMIAVYATHAAPDDPLSTLKIGVVLAMDRAEEGFRAMWQGETRGKTVFTR